MVGLKPLAPDMKIIILISICSVLCEKMFRQ